MANGLVYTWPDSGGGGSGSNASVGLTGQTAPSSATEVGGINPGGLLTAISVDNAGNQNVNVVSSALPTGSATAANQVLEITQLTDINTNTTAIEANQTNATQKTQLVDGSGNVIASTSNALNVNVTASALPTGGATAALQTTGNAALGSILLDLTNGTQLTGLVAGTALVGKVGIDQTTPGTTNGVVVNSSALPTGASTSALQTTGNISLASIANAAIAGSTAPVVTNPALVVSLSPNSSQINVTQVTPTPTTITNAAITVGTSAVRLTVSGSAPSSTRVVLAATPDVASTATFFIGGSGVTNSGGTRGIEIKAGQSFIANNDAADYFIVSSTAAQTVGVMEHS